MPLSEHEQRILADIEARLREDDPDFAASVGSARRQQRGRIRLAVAGAIVGFVLLFVGLQTHLVWGVVGFALLLASVYQGLILAKRLAAMQGGRGKAGSGGPLQRYVDGARRRDDGKS